MQTNVRDSVLPSGKRTMTENSTAVLVAAPLPLFLELSQMRFLQMTGSQVSQSSYVCHWNDLFFVGGGGVVVRRSKSIFFARLKLTV